MADKTSHLVLSALSRAAAEPGGLPLFASKAAAGLFPNSAAAKPVADRCLADGLLAPGPANAVRVTDKGRTYLIEQSNPRAVVEDFVRVLESRQGEVDQLLESAKRMAENLQGLKEAANAILPRVMTAKVRIEPQPTDLAETLFAALKHHAEGHDCPLPTLFRALTPAPSIGEFHDALRALHAAGRLYLHPWTGPLYSLPEPQFALLAGHEVAYYASLNEKFKMKN